MSRLPIIDEKTADASQAEVLGTVRKSLGSVPNLIAALANSPAAAKAYLSFSSSVSEGGLSRRIREQIALTVAQKNECEYCLAAHTTLGGMAGLAKEELIASRRGEASDPVEAAALTLARAIVDARGSVATAELDAAREAGLSDGDIAEVVANVALNIFTNYFNNLAETEIDFPVAPVLESASA